MEGGAVQYNRNAKVLDLAQRNIVGMNLWRVIPPAQHAQRDAGHSGSELTTQSMESKGDART